MKLFRAVGLGISSLGLLLSLALAVTLIFFAPKLSAPIRAVSGSFQSYVKGLTGQLEGARAGFQDTGEQINEVSSWLRNPPPSLSDDLLLQTALRAKVEERLMPQLEKTEAYVATIKNNQQALRSLTQNLSWFLGDISPAISQVDMNLAAFQLHTEGIKTVLDEILLGRLEASGRLGLAERLEQSQQALSQFTPLERVSEGLTQLQQISKQLETRLLSLWRTLLISLGLIILWFALGQWGLLKLNLLKRQQKIV
ncbi:MAG: hypothetical protein R2880_05550 [Deinococcales bacterium]